MFPLALAICENDLKRDLTFLKEFAGAGIDLRVTPIHGGSLDDKVARIVERQLTASEAAGLRVQALVVHHDVDRASLAARRNDVAKWYQGSGLVQRGCKLVICAPAPCTERWLCLASAIRVDRAKPSAGCEPWKKAWAHGHEPDLSRVRTATRQVRQALKSFDDFRAFYADWQGAGLEATATS